MNYKSVFSVWIDAARPKTLTASISPVILGCVLAYKDGYFKITQAILCFSIAILAQISSNFANDYFDYRKGADREDRLGPKRAVASGWISPKSMLVATFVTLFLSAMFGFFLLYLTDWKLIFVGFVILLCVIAYSAGPFPLAYNGLGDVCVLLFYGIIPVCYTYYVQALSFSNLSFLLSISLGLLSTNILIVNNYRDYEQDKISNKRTSVVLFGKKFGRYLYLTNGIISVLLLYPILKTSSWWIYLIITLYFCLFYNTYKDLTIKIGYELNNVLANTARNVFVFTIILAVILLIN